MKMATLHGISDAWIAVTVGVKPVCRLRMFLPVEDRKRQAARRRGISLGREFSSWRPR